MTDLARGCTTFPPSSAASNCVKLVPNNPAPPVRNRSRQPVAQALWGALDIQHVPRSDEGLGESGLRQPAII
ncbi:MAG: hypothetical protein QGF59_25710, partial [Pirellulaceae bacterium]|nr:hypothetical protein [Pirellulaceae bacterium]